MAVAGAGAPLFHRAKMPRGGGGESVAAWSVKFVPARLLGVLVAGLLLLTNFRELATWAELGVIRWAGYAAIVGAVVLAADPRVPWRTAPADNADLRPTAGS